MIRIVKSYILSLLLVFSGIACCPARPLPKAWVRDSLPALPGWEGFNVRLYEYRTGRDVRTGAPKTGRVYLLNPEPERLARWIATTCLEVKGSLGFEYTDRLLRWIRGQSGAQFPVRGVVYEAMERPGRYEPYVFKDGVTVYVADSARFPADGHCTPEQLAFYLTLTDADLKPRTGRYARICSTTREQYKAAGGRDEVGDSGSDRRLAWLDTVRRLYRRAMKSDRNELMIAWAKANL